MNLRETKRRRNQFVVPRTDPSIFIDKQNRIYKSNRPSIYKNSKIYIRVNRAREKGEGYLKVNCTASIAS